MAKAKCFTLPQPTRETATTLGRGSGGTRTNLLNSTTAEANGEKNEKSDFDTSKPGSNCDEKVKVAHNGTLLADRTSLSAHDGDEIALLPPVSGG